MAPGPIDNIHEGLTGSLFRQGPHSRHSRQHIFARYIQFIRQATYVSSLRSVYIVICRIYEGEEDDEEGYWAELDIWAEPDMAPLVRDTLRILDQGPNVTHLTLSTGFLYQVDGPTHEPCFLFLLAHKLPHLQHLTLPDRTVDSNIAFKALRVCFSHPQLVHLYFNFTIGDGGRTEAFRLFLADLEENKDKATLDQPAMGSRIKSLVLPYAAEGPPVELICTPLKLHLPSLERFYLPSLVRNPQVSVLELFRDSVTQGCPKLQHIDSKCYHGSVNIGNAVTGVIMGIKEWGLKDLLKLLEDVELVDFGLIAFNILSKLVSKCRNLKSVKIVPNGNQLIFLEHLLLEDWVCSDLKDFYVVISRDGHSRDKYNKSDDDMDGHSQAQMSQLDKWTRKMYRRIGRLSKLGTLCLDCAVRVGEEDGASDLTLDRGRLSELAGLKKLRHLSIPLSLCAQIGQAEIEFMDSQWPQLERFSLKYTQSERNITEKPQWQ
ncbi:hypothetical protein B0O80DRAFT_427657 [Mortierella sp. GBAus27b]|nr:hypothetical protein B0O80DRAFT_427657 [Mortierella sp. GBAus27b]